MKRIPYINKILITNIAKKILEANLKKYISKRMTYVSCTPTRQMICFSEYMDYKDMKEVLKCHI